MVETLHPHPFDDSMDEPVSSSGKICCTEREALGLTCRYVSAEATFLYEERKFG